MCRTSQVHRSSAPEKKKFTRENRDRGGTGDILAQMEGRAGSCSKKLRRTKVAGSWEVAPELRGPAGAPSNPVDGKDRDERGTREILQERASRRDWKVGPRPTAPF